MPTGVPLKESCFLLLSWLIKKKKNQKVEFLDAYLRQTQTISNLDSRMCWCSGNALRDEDEKEKRKKTETHREGRQGGGGRVSGRCSGWAGTFRTEFLASLKKRTDVGITCILANPVSSGESGKFFSVCLLPDSFGLFFFLFPMIAGSLCLGHLAAF